MEPDFSTSEGSRAGRWRLLPLLLVVAAVALVFATGAHRYLKLETIAQHRDALVAFVEAHRSQSLLLYMGVYIVIVALSIPGSVFLTVLGGFLFGWLVGGAAAAVSATLGATLLFLIARTSIGDALLAWAGPRAQRLAEGFRANALFYLLFLRFQPVVPFWITNLASALFGVKLRTFFLATQIGVIPGAYVFAVAGSGLDSVIEAQARARQACLAAGGSECGFELRVRSLVTPEIVAAFAALAVLALVPVLVKRFYGGRLTKAGR